MLHAAAATLQHHFPLLSRIVLSEGAIEPLPCDGESSHPPYSRSNRCPGDEFAVAIQVVFVLHLKVFQGDLQKRPHIPSKHDTKWVLENHSGIAVHTMVINNFPFHYLEAGIRHSSTCQDCTLMNTTLMIRLSYCKDSLFLIQKVWKLLQLATI